MTRSYRSLFAFFLLAACGGPSSGGPARPDMLPHGDMATSNTDGATNIVVTPTTAQAVFNEQIQFLATVAGSSNADVTWAVLERTQGGAVSATGAYTAPATVGTFHVVATNAADARKTASAAITVTAPVGDPCLAAGTCSPGSWVNVSPSGVDLGVYGLGAIVVNPKRKSDVYIGSGNAGVFKSTDYGQTWTEINTTTGRYGFGIAPTEPVTIFMGSGQGDGTLFRSTDDGQTFSIVGKGGLPADLYNFAVDPYDTSHVISGLHEVDGIVESTDGGTTWKMASSAGTSGWPTGGISWFPFFIDTGYADTTRGNWIAIAQDGASVCLTSNGGTSWSVPATIAGLQHAHSDTQIYQPEPGSSTLYVAGLYGPGQGVYKSTDFGATWARVDSGASPESLVWGTSKGIYAAYGWAIGSLGTQAPFFETSPVSGTTWTPTAMPSDINEGVQLVAVTFDGTREIFIASMWQKGIWRYIEP